MSVRVLHPTMPDDAPFQRNMCADPISTRGATTPISGVAGRALARRSCRDWAAPFPLVRGEMAAVGLVVRLTCVDNRLHARLNLEVTPRVKDCACRPAMSMGSPTSRHLDVRAFSKMVDCNSKLVPWRHWQGGDLPCPDEFNTLWWWIRSAIAVWPGNIVASEVVNLNPVSRAHATYSRLRVRHPPPVTALETWLGRRRSSRCNFI